MVEKILADILQAIEAINDFIQKKRHEDGDPVYIDLVTQASPGSLGTTSNPWIIDYRNRKHIFAYNPTSSTMGFFSNDQNLTNVDIPSRVWTNVSFPEGTRLMSNAAYFLKLKCTNEIVP